MPLVWYLPFACQDVCRRTRCARVSPTAPPINSNNQDVTLILCACLPFLAGAGALLARASTSANTRSQDAYTEVKFGPPRQT